MKCIEGEFRDRWHWCITGELTEEENLVSGILASMWTQVKKKKSDNIYV